MNLRHWLPALCGMACLGCGVGLIGIYGFFVEPLAQTFGVGVAAINTGPVALLLVPDGVSQLLPAMCLIGFGAGGFIPMHPYLNSRYFDAANIGQVNGAQMPLFLPFGLVGAPLAGYAYDQLGNYQLVFQCLGVALLVSAALALALPASRN